MQKIKKEKQSSLVHKSNTKLNTNNKSCVKINHGKGAVMKTLLFQLSVARQ